jgi:hypothetical protein
VPDTVVDASDGAELLIHETFPAASVFAKKAGIPEDLAEAIVNGLHTSPAMAGKVFEEMRTEHDGPVVISQDLTVFDVSKEAIVVRAACSTCMVGRRAHHRLRRRRTEAARHARSGASTPLRTDGARKAARTD